METLLRQAPMTANEYLGECKDILDRHYGEDYTRKHPELLGAMVITCALDMLAMVHLKATEESRHD